MDALKSVTAFSYPIITRGISVHLFFQANTEILQHLARCICNLRNGGASPNCLQKHAKRQVTFCLHFHEKNVTIIFINSKNFFPLFVSTRWSHLIFLYFASLNLSSNDPHKQIPRMLTSDESCIQH